MNLKLFSRGAAVVAFAAAVAVAGSASAHRQWMLPSMTVLSGTDPWVSVDAAVSNDLFVFEHQPMRLDNLVITGPDGAPVEAQNKFTGKYRSVFDLQLTKPGTYRVASVSGGMMASYKLNGEQKRWRGPAAELATAVPAGATDVKKSFNARRVEVFLTSGAPTETALKPTGKGLELIPVTHPNDVVAGEKATFGLVLDGKPAAGVEVTIEPGGTRFNDERGEIKVTTDAAGRFSVTWPKAGFYWLEADIRGAADADGVEHNAGYVATFEVLKD
ncbi:MAG: DUF4198 domain-containing protein [Caulobacter sp.]|nr:DUF4198 domain-containing protein [Caulobacter sp.]